MASCSLNRTRKLSSSSTYNNRATDGTDIGADIAALEAAMGGTGTPPPTEDTTRPTVSLTAPAASARVSGTVQMRATASDNVGVVGVQFYLDGAPLGNEDLASPFSVSWNSATISDGSHTLTAKARDAAGNVGTAADVTVTVTNTTPPAEGGLLHQSDLHYVGAFKVPVRTFGASSFEYGGTALAFNPANTSLFLVGHDYQQAVAELAIPSSIVNSGSLSSLANCYYAAGRYHEAIPMFRAILRDRERARHDYAAFAQVPVQLPEIAFVCLSGDHIARGLQCLPVTSFDDEVREHARGEVEAGAIEVVLQHVAPVCVGNAGFGFTDTVSRHNAKHRIAQGRDSGRNEGELDALKSIVGVALHFHREPLILEHAADVVVRAQEFRQAPRPLPLEVLRAHGPVLVRIESGQCRDERLTIGARQRLHGCAAHRRRAARP